METAWRGRWIRGSGRAFGQAFGRMAGTWCGTASDWSWAGFVSVSVASVEQRRLIGSWLIGDCDDWADSSRCQRLADLLVGREIVYLG